MRSFYIALALGVGLLLGACTLLFAAVVDLRTAAGEGDLESVQLLLKVDPATLNTPDADGRTPLIIAAGWGRNAVVEYLLNKGADVNKVDKDQRSALHWAAALDHRTIIALLLRNKVNTALKDKDGATAAQLARKQQKDEAAKLIEDFDRQNAKPTEKPDMRAKKVSAALGALGAAQRVELSWGAAELTPEIAAAGQPEALAADCAALNQKGLADGLPELARSKATGHAVQYLTVSLAGATPFADLRAKLGDMIAGQTGEFRDPAQPDARPLTWYTFDWLQFGVVDNQVRLVRADCTRVPGSVLPMGPIDVHLANNPKDGAEIVLVPAGEFSMGYDRGDGDEKPIHKVTLDAFWIYKNDVTVAQFRRFCQETARPLPPQPKTSSDTCPVVNVTWMEADAYAKWVGGSLPTEAQWEKAARGTDGRTFPWGNNFDVKNANVLESGTKRVVAAGSFPAGASPYGVLDMAGNVYQWCQDWYEDVYYGKSPAENPTGPAAALPADKNYKIEGARCIRGGSWAVSGMKCYAANRKPAGQAGRSDQRGFRVVMGLRGMAINGPM